MVEAKNIAVLVFSVGNLALHENALGNWCDFQHYDSFRQFKKQFRHGKPALIVASIGSDKDEALCKETTQFVRNGLANQDSRIVILRDPSFDLDEIHWMESLQVNACLSAEPEKQSVNITTLRREIDTFQYIDNHKRQHDAETEMLMCITKFSRSNESLSSLLQMFSSSLSALSYASCAFHIKILNDSEGEIEFCECHAGDIKAELNLVLGLPKISHYLKSALDEKLPQINLLSEDINLSSLETKLPEKVGSYLTFPLIVYNKPLYLLVYFIPESEMGKVSMKQINVISKASEQLTMLLERRQAESSLKKQYTRLKSTLVELKTTKQALQQQEKMASIGQMAAGIAHEINNPLSYVMSNFSSMDEYLNSILQLQELQSEFLSSIDMGQDNKVVQLKNNISKFSEEENMAFVLEDIRAVISDSHSGLKRVRDIITDLKSFTYSQSTELEICDFPEVVEDTLKVLSYDLGKSIDIDTRLSELPEFMAHNGLMQQVLTNLIKNAAQALTEAGTDNAKISIIAEKKDQSIFIVVRDNGPGIPADVQEKIFEPFFTTKTVGEGTGLGLSVTFNIIKKLGGEISLNSKEGEFTEFVIVFPIET
ncbi:MAG: ATP-binding protein [Paraglaciecola sp.]|uniref:sensor histidine kinase n=3 Tax=Paraglaciecola sp. TaxID=1920173 RepID=UPI0032972642